jgi:tetratricopeptide (TPR) repeat protein
VLRDYDTLSTYITMKTSIKTALLYLLFTVTNSVVAQHKNVFTLPFPEQYVTIDKIIDTLALQEDTIMASQRLEKLEQQAKATNDELTVLNYKRSEIRYRYIRTLGHEKKKVLNQLIVDTEKIIRSFDEQKYPVIAALLHFQIGNTLDYQKYNYKDQFKHYLKAYELFKDIPLKSFPYRYYSQYAIALAYHRFGDYDKAIYLCEEVEGLFPQKDFNSILTMNLIGVSYLELKKYDQALRSFQWILKNNQYALNPKAWEGIALCNLGGVYYAKGDNAKAKEYLEQGIPILKQEALIGNLASASMQMTKIYISQKNSLEAKRYLDILVEIKDKISSINFSYDLNKVLSEYYQFDGNSKLALFHLQLANVYKDSIDAAKNRDKKYKAEMDFENEQHKLYLYQIEVKNKNERLIGFIFFFLLLLFSLSIWVYYDRKKLKYKLKKQELLNKNKAITSELQLAYQRLDEYTQNRLRKKQENKTSSSNKLLKQEELVSQLANSSTIYSSEDWNEFKALFEKAYPGYISYVRKNFPKISVAELRFIAVNKLNLNIAEMALMLNISPDAIRKLKKRLSLRIAENLHQSFDEFMASLD